MQATWLVNRLIQMPKEPAKAPACTRHWEQAHGEKGGIPGMKERTWLRESLEARQKSGAQQEDVLKDTRRRHSNGPLDSQSSAFLNSQLLRKQRS